MSSMLSAPPSRDRVKPVMVCRSIVRNWRFAPTAPEATP